MGACRKIVFGLLTVLLLAFVAIPSLDAKPYCERLYDSARRDYYSLLESDRKQRFRDSWDKVIARFEEIVSKYPDCAKAPDSLFNIGLLYRKLYRVSWVKDDLVKAVESFRSISSTYPKDSLADDGLLNAAEILAEMGDKSGAYRSLDSLVRSYPRGDQAPEARRRLGELAAYAPRPEPEKTAARPVQTERVNVTDVKYWSNPDYSRVVVHTSGPIAWEKNQLREDRSAGKPPRLYVDIRRAAIPANLCNPIPIADGLLLQARVGQFDQDTVRLVLDIDSISDHRVFVMENPTRLVIDVVGESGQRTAAMPAAPSTSVESDTPLPLAQQLGLQVKRIVLDPGHGGKDPGAIGPNGLKEKDVTLALALRVKPLLEARGYEIMLTRSSDVYIELADRTGLANEQKADLFVSIHTNASRSRSVRGVETYFLGVAKTREESETAMLENAISQQALSDLEQILLDLTRTNNLRESSLLAETIQDSLYQGLASRYSNIRNHGVKQASFYVLIGAQMPAVLVEASFISHPQEEKLLATRDYRDVVSESILKGIIDFVEKRAPLAEAGTGETS